MELKDCFFLVVFATQTNNEGNKKRYRYMCLMVDNARYLFSRCVGPLAFCAVQWSEAVLRCKTELDSHPKLKQHSMKPLVDSEVNSSGRKNTDLEMSIVMKLA